MAAEPKADGAPTSAPTALPQQGSDYVVRTGDSLPQVLRQAGLARDDLRVVARLCGSFAPGVTIHVPTQAEVDAKRDELVRGSDGADAPHADLGAASPAGGLAAPTRSGVGRGPATAATREPTGPRQAPVETYFAAMDAWEGRAKGKGAPAVPAAPKGIGPEMWAQARALERQGLSAADVRYFAEHGRLPDVVDGAGKVVLGADARFAELERAATRDGSWTAVNSFTFLVGARRSAMADERELMAAELAGLAPGAALRAPLEAALDESRKLDQQLRTGLQSIYGAATLARERGSQALVLQAARLEEQATRARAGGDGARADKLEGQARNMRDRAAKAAAAEAAYRSTVKAGGYPAARVFQLAAEAQIGRGRAEVAAAVRSGKLLDTPPASLGDDDGAKTGNGVAGAGRLLAQARAADPNAAREHRQLALEGSRQDSLAVFHREHLARSGYFDRVTDGKAPPARTPAQLAHRAAYADARATQAAVAGDRLELYAAAGAKLPATDARAAVAVARERRQALDELGGSLAQSLASDRALAEADLRRGDAGKALAEARTGEVEAQKAVADAGEAQDRAIDQRKAVFGDTFKTGGEARRDDEGVADARTVMDGERRRADFSVRRRVAAEGAVARADVDVAAARAQSERDAQDAAVVSRALAGHPRLAAAGAGNEPGYLAVRAEADAAAHKAAGFLAQAAPAKGVGAPPALTAEIASARLELAGYWTQSAEVNALARGEAGRDDARGRLDAAAGLVGAADQGRLALDVRDPARLALASGLVDARSALAEANADYRPGVSRDELAAAEQVAGGDLTVSPELAAAARERIGAAAVASLARHDLRFDEVARGGGHDARADDALYAQAHRLLNGDAMGPAAVQARARLSAIDESLGAVDDILGASADQLHNGEAYAEAQTRAMGRADIAAGQAKVSTVISGGAWLLSFGQFDMKEEMAEAGEGATRNFISNAHRANAQQIEGSRQLGGAWQKARAEGRPFELLGSVRLLANRDNRTLVPAAYGQALSFVSSRVDGGRNDWQDFNRVAIREGQIPVARALAGPVQGYAAARDAFGDRGLGVVTADAASMLQSQADKLKDTSHNLGWYLVTNVGLEVALGIVATGGFGSAGALAKGGQAANAGRTGLQVMKAAEAAGTLARASQVLGTARAAHPVLSTLAVSTVVGTGMMGTSWAFRRLFGASSGMARAVDVAANFIPIGAGHRAAGLPQAAERAAMAGREGAQAAARLGVLRQAVSAERLVAHARFYGPQIALGSGQAVVTAVATPALADELGVRSEAGQAVIGLLLNTVMSGGVAVGTARFGSRGGPTADLATAMGFEKPGARAAARKELDAFAATGDGRIPTAAETATLQKRLYKLAGVTEGGDAAMAERRQAVDAGVEALRMRAVGSLALREVRGADAKGPLDAGQARRAVELTAEKLYASRGGKDGGASWAQAYRDGVDLVTRGLGDAAPEALTQVHRAAVDAASAGEIAATFSVPGEPGGKAVIGTPAQQAKVERVLASELGALRQTLESGRGPKLTDTAHGPSAFQRVAERLRREAGLTPDGAEAVLRSVQHDVVERGVAARLVAEQEAVRAPLTEARVAEVGQEVAEQAGLPPDAAAGLGRDLAQKRGFVDFVRAQLPMRFWTPEIHREALLKNAPESAQVELQKLTAAHLLAIYPEGGPFPWGLARMADVPGFGDFAASDPQGARKLADMATIRGSGTFDVASNEVQQHGPAGFANAVAWADTRLPAVTQHATHPQYTAVRRNKDTPSSLPEVDLRPKVELDHNGAFMQPAPSAKGEWVGTKYVSFEAPEPGQLIVNGQPLASLDGVMVFSGHGATTGYAGISTSQAVDMVAAEIVAQKQAGRSIDYVVLNACNQRNSRWLIGESNSQVFQRELTAKLQAQGITGVKVLAAAKPGSTYGYGYTKTSLPFHRDAQSGKLRLGHGEIPLTFTTTDYATPYVDPLAWKLGLGIGAGLAAEAGLLYYVVGDRREEHPPAPAPP